MTEDLPLAATTVKGRTRAAMTQELLAAAEAGRVRIAIGRASDFFGAGATESSLGERVFGNAVAGKRADFIGNPDLPHTYSYVPDIAAGLATLGTDERAIGGVWHLPGPETVTTRAAARARRRRRRAPGRRSLLPKLAVRALGLFNPTMRELVELSYEFDEPFVLDTTKYESTFGTDGTPLATAITATVAWYRDRQRRPLHSDGDRAMTITRRRTACVPAVLQPGDRRIGSSSRRPPQDGGEDVVRFNWRSMPGGSITEHVHPHQEERFVITAGEAHFTLDGEERVVGPGETLVVPIGVRHSESNPGSVAIEGVVELRPALHTKEMFEAFGGLGAEGKTTPRGAPKNPLQLGATLWHFRHESRATSPPIWIQNLILPPLAALAKLFGVRPYYDRWDSRNTPRSEPAA